MNRLLLSSFALLLLSACGTKPATEKEPDVIVKTESDDIVREVITESQSVFWYDTTLVSSFFVEKTQERFYHTVDSCSFSNGRGETYTLFFCQDSLSDIGIPNRLEFWHKGECIKTENNDDGFDRFFLGFFLDTAGSYKQSKELCKVIKMGSDYLAVLLEGDNRPTAHELLIYIIHNDQVTLIFQEPKINFAFKEGHIPVLYTKSNYDEPASDESIYQTPCSSIIFYEGEIVEYWENGQRHTIFSTKGEPFNQEVYKRPKERVVYKYGKFFEMFKHFRYETVMDEKALDAFSDFNIAERPFQSDSTYALILAYCLRDEVDGALAEVFYYDMYQMFKNRSEEFNNIADKLLLLPEEERTGIRETIQDILKTEFYEAHSESLGDWGDNSDSIVWAQCRDSFPQCSVLFPY